MRLSPTEALDRAAALIQPSRRHRHRHRYFGVLAPDSPWREAVTSRAGGLLRLTSFLRRPARQPHSAGLGVARDGSAGAWNRQQAPQHPWTLATLAQRIGLSRSAFAARFNQLVGRTPVQYLTFWRMQKARELLSETRLGTAAIAERVGYQSEAAFGKVFKKVVDTGPGAYRRDSSRR